MTGGIAETRASTKVEGQQADDMASEESNALFKACKWLGEALSESLEGIGNSIRSVVLKSEIANLKKDYIKQGIKLNDTGIRLGKLEQKKEELKESLEELKRDRKKNDDTLEVEFPLEQEMGVNGAYVDLGIKLVYRDKSKPTQLDMLINERREEYKSVREDLRNTRKERKEIKQDAKRIKHEIQAKQQELKALNNDRPIAESRKT